MLWKVVGPEWNIVGGGGYYKAKPVTKNRVYEKIRVDRFLKLILAFYGAHNCRVRGHKTPLQDFGPKCRLDMNLRVISSKWRVFWTHCSICGYFLTNLGRILYYRVYCLYAINSFRHLNVIMNKISVACFWSFTRKNTAQNRHVSFSSFLNEKYSNNVIHFSQLMTAECCFSSSGMPLAACCGRMTSYYALPSQLRSSVMFAMLIWGI